MSAEEEFIVSWAERTKKTAELEFIHAMYMSILSAGPLIDKAASWLLAGIGATAALMVANLDDLSTVLEPTELKILLALLAVSALFGLGQKLQAVKVGIAYTLMNKIFELTPQIFQEHQAAAERIAAAAEAQKVQVSTDVDPEFVRQELLKAVPKFSRFIFRRNFDAGFNDRLYGTRRAVRAFFWQALWARAEFLSAVLVVLIAMATFDY